MLNINETWVSRQGKVQPLEHPAAQTINRAQGIYLRFKYLEIISGVEDA